MFGRWYHASSFIFNTILFVLNLQSALITHISILAPISAGVAALNVFLIFLSAKHLQFYRLSTPQPD